MTLPSKNPSSRYSQSRDEYLLAAQAREDEALRLKESGLKDRQIAAKMDTTYYAVTGLLKRARKRRVAAADQHD